MPRQSLFEKLPRTPRKKLMHVNDAGGDGYVNFICGHCGYDDGWSEVQTVTKAKRGKPCPKCNEAKGEAEKPLFIPLKTVFFEQFEDGSKTHEYRKAGGRWNAKTCRVGRAVVLSKGYGKAHRLTGAVDSFEESPGC